MIVLNIINQFLQQISWFVCLDHSIWTLFLMIFLREVLTGNRGVVIIPNIKHLHKVGLLAVTLRPTYFWRSCILGSLTIFLAGFDSRLDLFLNLYEMTRVLVLAIVVIAVNKLTTIAWDNRLVNYFVKATWVILPLSISLLSEIFWILGISRAIFCDRLDSTGHHNFYSFEIFLTCTASFNQRVVLLF